MSLQRKHAGENPNKDIVDMLVELADYERNVTRALHKSNAYRKVRLRARLVSVGSFLMKRGFCHLHLHARALNLF